MHLSIPSLRGNGMKLTCSEIIFVSCTLCCPFFPQLSGWSCLFHSACFHLGLIDPRWANSEQLQQNPLKLGFYWHWSITMSREPQPSLNTPPTPDGSVVSPSSMHLTCVLPLLMTAATLCAYLGLQGFSGVLSSPLQPVVLIGITKGSLK